MPTASIGEDGGRGQIIERQMRLWYLNHPTATGVSRTHSVYRAITISRQTGCLAEEIANELGRQIGWHVFDREIVDYIARNKHVRQDLVRQLDEKSRSLIEDSIERFLTLVEEGSFGLEEYHDGLLKTLAFLAARGGAIIIGRGSNFVLRDKSALHVRVIGSPKVRVDRLSQRWQVPPDEARRGMLQQDTNRRDFVRHHFKHDVDDLGYYNAVYNTDHLTPQQVVAAILGLLKLPRSSRDTAVAAR